MSEENINQEAVTEAAGSNVETTQSEAPASTGLFDTLPEELRNDPSIKDFKDMEGLTKSYIASQRMLGNSVRIPGEDASQEAKDEFYSKLTQIPGVARIPGDDDPEAKKQLYRSLGMPESPNDYKVEIPEGTEPGVVENFKNVAHQLGLNNEQAQALIGFEQERAAGYTEQMNKAYEQGEASLRKEWGVDYENRLAGAKAALNMYAGEESDAVSEILSSPLASNPVVLKILSAHHKSLQESGTLAPTASQVSYGMSPDEAKAKISDIMNNPEHVYHTGNPDAYERMNKLTRAAYPG